MYYKIVNPNTGKLVSINSNLGRKIIMRYYEFMQNGGSELRKSESMEEKFTNIYKKNIWGSSGSGSNFSPDNKWYLELLREHIDKYDLKKIADLGCGDWEIMKHFKFKNKEKYTGMDCVKFLVNNLNKNYGKKNIKFIHNDISRKIPKGYDLIILKDVIQHWSDEQINKVLPEILKNNKYVFSINGYKFTRDPSKNSWKERKLDKRYNYHPIIISKKPLKKYKKFIKNINHRRSKEYILFKC